MPIEFTCPQCGHTNLSQDGQPVVCDSCGACSSISISPTKILWRVVKLLVFVAVCLGLAVSFLLPAVVQPVEANRRMVCRNNLKQIGLAFHHYHEVHLTFPPACLTDENGQPTRSWRELLIPYLLPKPQFQDDRFDQQGASAEQQQLAIGRAVTTYACPSDPAHTDDSSFTNYVLLTGLGTVYDADREPCIANILDGTSNTILAVEVRNAGILWRTPRDLDIETFVAMFGPQGTLQTASPHPGGLNVLLVDGSVYFLNSMVDPEKVRALATSMGGERVDVTDLY